MTLVGKLESGVIARVPLVLIFCHVAGLSMKNYSSPDNIDNNAFNTQQIVNLSHSFFHSFIFILLQPPGVKR